MRLQTNVDYDDLDLNYDDYSFLPNGHQAVWSPANDKPKDKHCNIDNRQFQYLNISTAIQTIRNIISIFQKFNYNIDNRKYNFSILKFQLQ